MSLPTSDHRGTVGAAEYETQYEELRRTLAGLHRLEEALKPFLEAASHIPGYWPNESVVTFKMFGCYSPRVGMDIFSKDPGDIGPTVGDYRRLFRAVEGGEVNYGQETQRQGQVLS